MSPSWCGTILRLLCAVGRHFGRDWRGDYDYGDGRDYGVPRFDRNEEGRMEKRSCPKETDTKRASFVSPEELCYGHGVDPKIEARSYAFKGSSPILANNSLTVAQGSRIPLLRNSAKQSPSVEESSPSW